MTAEDWKYVQDNWGALFTTIKFKIDGYDVSLQAGVAKMKIYVCCFVNGEFKGAWLSTKDQIICEEARRFLQSRKKALVSAKDLKVRQKAFGKRHKFSQQTYYWYITPFWSSFSAFKKHIIENNKDIELIRS